TSITIPPSTSKPQKKQSRRKQKKTNAVLHLSDSTTDVPNEESMPTHSNDPLLSGEDRLKLTNLMDMCTKLSERVLDLEHTKTVQAQEITNFKVEYSNDESLGAQEDASKQGRSIANIDKDAEVSLVNETQGRSNDAEMFNTDALIVAQALAATKSAKPKEKDVVQESSENVSTATTMVSTATITVVATPAITTPPQQRAKGIAFREPVESTVTTTVPSQKSKDKGKTIMIEPENSLKKKDQIELDEELAREIEDEKQAKLERIQKERAAQEEASRGAIYEEWDNEQAMIKADCYSHAYLKDKSFDEVQKLFEKHMKWINSFVPMEEDLPSEKVQKEESSENKAEGSSRKKSIGRKRAKDKQEQESSKRQRVEDDKEEEELKNTF
ncbi:hypothetical protein Tco_0791499, partial [Tanacetum coccineum]